MILSKELDVLLAPLGALQNLIIRFDNQGIIIGGVAVSMLGKPRFTADVDAMMLLSLEDLPRLVKVAAEEGLIPRITDAEEFARDRRVLLLHHEESGINVDISLGLLPFEVEAVERSVVHQAYPIMIRLPTPEDLIILKAIAHRPKDLEDIRAIIASTPNLDQTRIEYWVGGFAQMLERPELWEDIAVLLPQPR